MAEYLAEPGNRTRPPIHPGVIFAEEIMAVLRERRTVSEIARLLGVSRCHAASADGRRNRDESRDGGAHR